MATQTVAAGGGNWSASATWSPGSVPANGDDVVLNATSGQLTIDVNTNTIRSIVCTGYTGTLTHNAGVTLNIGGASAPVGNIALLFVGTETYTLGNAATSAISIADTSAATNTYNFSGVTIGNLTINNGTTTTTQLTSNGFLQGSGATVTLTQGKFDTNGQTCTFGAFSSSNSNTRSIILGASAITVSGASGWNSATATNLTVTPGTSTITVTGAASSFSGGGSTTYNNLTITGTGTFLLSNASASPTFTNLTYNPTSGKTNILSVAAGLVTVTSTLTLTGAAAPNRTLVQSSIIGTQRTISAATVSITNTDFQDMKGGGAANPFTGTSLGDCLGNSQITFDTPAAQTWSGNTTGNWSTSGNWTSRVPLPQDNAAINALTNGTITADCPRLGKNIDFTSSTGGTLAMTSVANTFYGNWTSAAGLTMTGNLGLTFSGRGSQTITSAGVAWSATVIIASSGGTYTLQDNINVSGGGSQISHQLGTFSANNFNVSCKLYTNNFNIGSGVRVLNMGSGTWTLNGTSGNVWGTFTTGLTTNANTSTIAITDTGASSKTFAGGGQTYYNLSITGGGAGAVIFTGANTFNHLPQVVGGTKSITWPGSTTTTFTNGGNFGNGTNVLTFTASAGSATLSFGSQVNANFLNLTNIPAAGVTPAYAGGNSTDGGGNTNWVFTAAPSGTVALPSIANKFVGSMAMRHNFQVRTRPRGVYTPIIYTQSPAGVLSFSGTIKKQTNIPIAASLTSVGILAKQTTRVMVAALAFGGNLARTTSKAAFTAVLSFAGVQVKTIIKILVANQTFAGNINMLTSRLLSANATFVGNVAKTLRRALATATLSYSGSLNKIPNKNFLAVASFVGTWTKLPKKLLQAQLPFSGNLNRRITRAMQAGLPLAGLVLKTIPKTFTATFSFIGSLANFKAHFITQIIGLLIQAGEDDAVAKGSSGQATLQAGEDDATITNKVT